MKTFKTDIRVHYSETDAMQIVYHGNYIKYFETGRCEMLRELGYPYASLEEYGVRLPIIECSCQYVRPAVYDDLLEIQTTIEKFHGARVSLSYEIYRKDTKELLVTGKTKMAIVDTNLRPIILRKKMPELYEKLQSLEIESQ